MLERQCSCARAAEVGQRAQVYAGSLYVYRGRFSSGKPTIRPVLKRNVAAVTRPFVLQRVGGRRTAGYTFCPEAKNELNSRERRVFVRERRSDGERGRERESERRSRKIIVRRMSSGPLYPGTYTRHQTTQFDVLLWSKWDESTIDVSAGLSDSGSAGFYRFRPCRWPVLSAFSPLPNSFSRSSASPSSFCSQASLSRADGDSSLVVRSSACSTQVQFARFLTDDDRAGQFVPSEVLVLECSSPFRFIRSPPVAA